MMLKRCFLMTCCLVTVWLVCPAQKKELGEARTFIKSGKSLDKAEKMMLQLLKDSANRQNKKIHLTLYDAVAKQYELANEKLYLRQKYDTAQFFDLVQHLYRVAETLDSVDALPDKRGRIRPEYRQQHAATMNQLRPNLYFGGTYQLRKNDYRKAFDFFDIYLDADRQPLFTGYDYLKNDSLAPRAAYWATFAGYRLQDPELTLRYRNEALLDSARKDFVLQYLCEAYHQQGDTNQWLSHLHEGFRLFPESTYFFPRLADYYAANQRNDSVLILAAQGLSDNPDNELFLLAQSNALLNLERYEECREICGRLLELNDTMPDPYFNMATTYLNEALVLERKNEPRKYRQQLRALYQQARPYMEDYRRLAADEKQRWAPALYRIYLNLNMGKQFEEIDQLISSTKVNNS